MCPTYRLNNTNAHKAVEAAAKTCFAIEYEGSPITGIRVGLERACRRAGVEHHVFKHPGDTWMIQPGTSVGTPRKHYGHLSPENLKLVGMAVTI